MRYAPSASAPSDLATYGADDVVGVAQGYRPNVDEAVRQSDGLHQRMAVRLNEARHDAAVTEIDGLRVGTDELADLGPVAHGNDSAVGHGESLGGGPGVVDGQHGSGNDDICGGHGQRS